MYFLQELTREMNADMTPIKNFEHRPILLITVSFLSLFAITSFMENFAQSAYADINFGAVGDWGCDQNAQKTADNMDLKNPETAFTLGDNSYRTTEDTPSPAQCWINILSSANVPVKPTTGNHDDDDDEGYDDYQSFYGLSKPYYSFNQQNVHVLVMDTDKNSFSSGSSQYNFVQSDLQAASQNPAIDWIIVYLHKPFYTSNNSCDSTGCTNTGSVATNLRNTYGAFFDEVGVDLVLAGHVHNYQRTFPLNYDAGSPSSPTITSNNANTYTNPGGTIYVIVGTGGVGFHPLSNKAPFVSKQQDDDFGQLDIIITNGGSKLEGRFYSNDNNAILDSFSISKAPNVPPTANSQTALTGKDISKRIALTASDPNNDALTYSIVTQPQHGTITAGSGQVRTYTPTPGYTGPDSFTFRANDGTANSNTATVSITVVDPATCPANLPVSSVFASDDDGNIPSNVLDNNLATRWSNSPGQSWIAADLGSSKEICSVDLAWYLGNLREYAYLVIKSTDGNTWTDAFSGSSTVTIQVNRANTANIEKNFIPSTNARYIGIIGIGLSNTLVGITEEDIFSQSLSLSGGYQYEPSLGLSGPS